MQSPSSSAASSEQPLIQPLCAIFRRFLKRQGLKFTAERALILDAVLSQEGVFEAEELARVDALGLSMVVHDANQLAMLAGFRPSQPLSIWLKFNTGMNRAGFAPARARELFADLSADGRIGSLVMMTHLARADEPDNEATAEQWRCFRDALEGIPAPRSICNSAGVLGWPQLRADWARPGIMLYGADPMPGEGHGLRPVMTLESRIMAVRALQPGDAVGYGARFVADAPRRIGLVAMGYADGYPRVVPDGTPVAVAGQASRILGRVSMDMLTVDLDGIDAGLGSRVELWGGQVPVNRVAEAAGTIAYELLCNVKRARLEYVGA